MYVPAQLCTVIYFFLIMALWCRTDECHLMVSEQTHEARLMTLSPPVSPKGSWQSRCPWRRVSLQIAAIMLILGAELVWCHPPPLFHSPLFLFSQQFRGCSLLCFVALSHSNLSVLCFFTTEPSSPLSSFKSEILPQPKFYNVLMGQFFFVCYIIFIYIAYHV